MTMRGMRRLLLGLTLISLATVWLVAAPFAATAKGPSKAVVEGPGLTSPIRMRFPDSVELSSLIQHSGIWDQLFCHGCGRLEERNPAEQLGAAYRVTYTMLFPEGKRETSSDVVQYVYPFASPTPVTYVETGQPFWNTKTGGGWFVAGPRLRGIMTDMIGVPVPGQQSATTDTEGETPSHALAFAGGAVVVAIVIVALALLLRRRRAQPAAPAHSATPVN